MRRDCALHTHALHSQLYKTNHSVKLVDLRAHDHIMQQKISMMQRSLKLVQ